VRLALHSCHHPHRLPNQHCPPPPAPTVSVQSGHNGGANEGKVQLFEFLRGMCHKGRPLMLNPDRLLSLSQLQAALLRGDRYLEDIDDEV
jgi:hypothetical protein